ncbi:hypothetical protein SK128_002459 [Halocaridina rubra]|uniref:Uncharacterized protein n=1 Tax=Halocaridina rubra TaxID=373956 RepID=A0AAN8XWU0_HALRR
MKSLVIFVSVLLLVGLSTAYPSAKADPEASHQYPGSNRFLHRHTGGHYGPYYHSHPGGQLPHYHRGGHTVFVPSYPHGHA